MPSLSAPLNPTEGQPTGGAGRTLSRDPLTDPYDGAGLPQALSAGVTGLADTPAAIWAALSWLANHAGAAEPDPRAPPGDTPPAPVVPSFSSTDVPSLLGLPPMAPTLGNETVRAATGLLGLGAGARALRAGVERLAGPVSRGAERVLRAFEMPKPATGGGLITGQGLGTTIVDNPANQEMIPAPLKVAIPVATSLGLGGLGHVVDSVAPTLFSTAGAADRIALTGLTRSMANPGAARRTLLDYQFDPGTALADPATGGGYRTTAEVGGDPGLIDLERTLRGDPNPEIKRGFIANDIARTEARGGLLDRVVPPQSDATPPVPRDAAGVAAVLQPQADAQIAAAQAQHDAEIAAAQAQRDARLAEARQGVAALGPAESDVQLAGQRLQQPLVAARQASEEAAQTLFRSIDPEASTAIATRPIRDAAIAEARTRYPGEAFYPADLKTVLAQLQPDTLTLGDLQSIRGGLRTSDQRLQGVFSKIGPAIGDAVDAAAAAGEGIAPAQATRYAAWKRAYAQHAATYGEGPVGQATEISMGRPEMGPASVPGQFFRTGPGGADTMTAFNQAVAGAGEQAPVLTRAMRGHIAGALDGLLNDEGVLTPPVLARWLRNHGPAISRLPADLRAQLGTVEGATTLLHEATQNVADTTATATRTLADATASRGRGIAAAFLDGADPAAAIKRALSGPQATNNLRDLVGRMRQGPPEAMQQLRRAVLDAWMDDATLTNPLGASGEARTMSAAKGTTWWDRNRAPLQAAGAFSADELRRLDLLQNDLFSRQRLNTVGMGAGSPTRQYTSNAAMLDTLLQGAAVPERLAPFVGRAGSLLTNLPYVKDFLAQSVAKGRARLAEAMLNPAVAADLMRSADPDVVARLTQQMPRWWSATAAARGVPAAAAGANAP